MENEVIFSKEYSSGSVYEIAVNGNNVIFREINPTHGDASRRNYLYGVFPFENYVSGIEQLIKIGKCKIKGDGSEIQMKKNPKDGCINFNYQEEYTNPHRPSMMRGVGLCFGNMPEDLQIKNRK